MAATAGPAKPMPQRMPSIRRELEPSEPGSRLDEAAIDQEQTKHGHEAAGQEAPADAADVALQGVDRHRRRSQVVVAQKHGREG